MLNRGLEQSVCLLRHAMEISCAHNLWLVGRRATEDISFNKNTVTANIPFLAGRPALSSSKKSAIQHDSFAWLRNAGSVIDHFFHKPR